MALSAFQRHLVKGLVCVSLLGGARAGLAQDNHGSVVLVLKDPTPRPPDLEKIYSSTPAPSGVSAAQLASYNQQRYQLISRASTHIQTLSGALVQSLEQHRDGSPLTQEAQAVGMIEVLAANIYKALSPQRASTNSNEVSSDQSKEPAQLTADARELATLSTQLQAEVARSSPDALPVGVLLKSAKVRDLAHSLKDRMQRP